MGDILPCLCFMEHRDITLEIQQLLRDLLKSMLWGGVIRSDRALKILGRGKSRRQKLSRAFYSIIFKINTITSYKKP